MFVVPPLERYDHIIFGCVRNLVGDQMVSLASGALRSHSYTRPTGTGRTDGRDIYSVVSRVFVSHVFGEGR